MIECRTCVGRYYKGDIVAIYANGRVYNLFIDRDTCLDVRRDGEEHETVARPPRYESANLGRFDKDDEMIVYANGNEYRILIEGDDQIPFSVRDGGFGGYYQAKDEKALKPIAKNERLP